MKMLKTIFFLTFVTGSLVACVTPMHQEIAKVKVDMDKGDVLEIIGSPTISLRRHSQDRWIYKYPVEKNMQAMQITFEDGYVIAMAPYSMRPSRDHQNIDSSNIKEYEKSIDRSRNEEVGEFIDLEQ
jgi:outer membrane protein assembly factor BamE (lipoprotein component of BamABCDE complex)